MDRSERRSETETGRPSRTEADLTRIRGYMEQHYHEPLSVEQLAGMANISSKYFIQVFKKTYGHSPLDYLTDLRINRAKRYLAESDYRLREIAHKVGYSDEFYFSRKFKKEVGMPPSSFIKHPRQRIAAYSPSLIGQLLALNMIPVAAPLDSKWTPYYYHLYSSRIKLHMNYGAAQSPMESDKLISVRPDAIVGTELAEDEDKRKLSHIAPTLFVCVERFGWKEQLNEIAVFVGREKQAKAWIAAYDRKVKLARDRMEKAVGDDSFVVLRIYENDIHIYCNNAIRDVLYGDLKLVPACRNEMMHNQKVTVEQLREMNADRILVLVCPEAVSRSYWLSLQHTTEWRKLNAVRQGYVYQIPSDPWFEYSAVAVDRMLNETMLLFSGYCPTPLMDKVHGDSPTREI